ncbi:MAG TPA: mannose-6-phosphate isomerase, class I [Ignavibacteriales bacterium]|nr:mannose-6-phosphate isomerase, class I [Ignavibacteriales bacterium]
MNVFKLTGNIQHYDWGTRNENAYIPKLLNIKTEPNKPYAEYWLGVHPSLPSKIIYKNETILLSDFIEKEKDIIGTKFYEKYIKLPFLLKVLSIEQPLSIQAHPNKQQAAVLHLKDPNNYPDDNHKPEIAIAIDKLEALVGLKSIEKLNELFVIFPEIKTYLNHFINVESHSPSDIFKAYVSNSQNNPEYAKLTDFIYNKIKSENDKLSNYYKFCYEKYGKYDVGLLCLYLLNFVELKEGEAVFLEAGIPHAYLTGNIVECMANSDNVVRIGLTPKFKDIATLIKIFKVTDDLLLIKPVSEVFDYITEGFGAKSQLQRPSSLHRPSQIENSKNAFNIEFNIRRVFSKSQVEFNSYDKFYILLNIGNSFALRNFNEEIIVNKGEAYLIGVNNDLKFIPTTDLQIFLVSYN